MPIVRKWSFAGLLLLVALSLLPYEAANAATIPENARAASDGTGW